MKAKDLKNIKTSLVLCGKTYMIAFDFNAMAEIDEVYEGGFSKAMTGFTKGNLKAIRAIVYGVIKPRYQNVTLLSVGEMLSETIGNKEKTAYVQEVIGKAFELAMPSKEDTEDDMGEQKPQLAK